MPKDKFSYTNMIEKSFYTNYIWESMINGILIDMHDDTLDTDRAIYALSDLAGSVGGFFSFVRVVIIFMLPFIRNAELDSYLISSLYK